MSDLPAMFASALEEAELHAFGVLCAATGMTSGRNAFIGEASGKMGVMEFAFTTTFQGDTAFWARHSFTELPFIADATGRFRTRREVWTWFLRVVQALPITQAAGNLRLFRVEQPGSITPVEETMPDGKIKVTGWQMVVRFNTVCLTSGIAEGTQ